MLAHLKTGNFWCQLILCLQLLSLPLYSETKWSSNICHRQLDSHRKALNSTFWRIVCSRLICGLVWVGEHCWTGGKFSIYKSKQAARRVVVQLPTNHGNPTFVPPITIRHWTPTWKLQKYTFFCSSSFCTTEYCWQSGMKFLKRKNTLEWKTLCVWVLW